MLPTGFLAFSRNGKKEHQEACAIRSRDFIFLSCFIFSYFTVCYYHCTFLQALSFLTQSTIVKSLLPLCRCLTSRELLKHHQKCVNQSCPVCTPVKQYVQKQRMVMQKQQQEMLARKEAEARGYGNAHMMQVCCCCQTFTPTSGRSCQPHLPIYYHSPQTAFLSSYDHLLYCRV